MIFELVLLLFWRCIYILLATSHIFALLHHDGALVKTKHCQRKPTARKFGRVNFSSDLRNSPDLPINPGSDLERFLS